MRNGNKQEYSLGGICAKTSQKYSISGTVILYAETPCMCLLKYNSNHHYVSLSFTISIISILDALHDGYTSNGKEMKAIPSLWFILIPFP